MEAMTLEVNIKACVVNPTGWVHATPNYEDL